MKWFWNQYLPDEAARIEPTASPLSGPIEQLKSLPPALIVTDENDVLRTKRGKKPTAASPNSAATTVSPALISARARIRSIMAPDATG